MGRYEAEWRRYRRLRRLSLLFFVPFCGIPLFLNVAGPNPFAALFPILFIVGVIDVDAWFVLNYFRCPRCGKLLRLHGGTTWAYLRVDASIAVFRSSVMVTMLSMQR